MRRRTVLSLLAAAWLGIAGPAGAGQTVLDEVFPDGLPFPFERVLDRLRAEAGADAVRTALIPLGRSLQRYSAAPDYFGSPRIIVAVSGDRAQGPEMPRLADRLYLGYLPAAAVVEAISYDEAAGRFAFQQIVRYGLDGAWRTEAAERSICLRCHQAEGPIFARPLWSESNANPMVTARLDALGPAFHGVPVRQTVDTLDAFDAATDRAARIAVANRLWAEGCPDAPCRAELFLAALRFGLNGSRAGWRAGQGVATAAFAERTATLWPEGVAVVSADLPNRDPARMLAAANPGPLIETAGELNPETPRAPAVLWVPGADGVDDAVREIAAMLSPGDFDWLDSLLRERESSRQALSLACTIRTARLQVGEETRFACGDDKKRVEGFLRPDGAGRIDRLTVNGADAPARIGIRARADRDGFAMEAIGPSPRLPDGARIGSLELRAKTMSLSIFDDFAQLGVALQARARGGSPAFGQGPFHRRALLTLVANVVGGENG